MAVRGGRYLPSPSTLFLARVSTPGRGKDSGGGGIDSAVSPYPDGIAGPGKRGVCGLGLGFGLGLEAFFVLMVRVVGRT